MNNNVPRTWHAYTAAETLDALKSSADGLTSAEVAKRMTSFGPNRLRRARPTHWTSILFSQFKGVVILLLVVAAGISFLIGDHLEAIAITIVLGINAGIGFAVEYRARRAMEALLHFEVPYATVLRVGRRERIPADQLVPGDVILVESGDSVPADARLIEETELRTSEAPLTGESRPVSKDTRATDPDTPLADRRSMLFAGTLVSVGVGRAVVVETGMSTQIGRIGRLLEGIEETQTPLERRLDALGRRLVWLTLGVAGLVVVLGVIQGTPWSVMVEAGIALAIAAVPEGLTAVATIALAVGLRRMARRQALVRKLSAVEALGSTTVVCTDKTGTLTTGQMTATAVVLDEASYRVSGVGFFEEGGFFLDGAQIDPSGNEQLATLLKSAALTARAEVGDGKMAGDPTDAALLILARKAGYHPQQLAAASPQVAEVPFSSERRYSASYHEGPAGTEVMLKGAPGRLLELCSMVATSEGARPLRASARASVLEANDELARSGLRVIAFAKGPASLDGPSGDALPETLTFLGLVGITDPPAPGVKESIRLLHGAGIRTVMITGDQEATAASIALDLGIMDERGSTLGGRALGSLTREELAHAVATTGAFCRVGPEQKLTIVEALQEAGAIVAMLGDGVNDAAALKAADVGVAMGVRGTDVAKETASIVLQDDRFGTVAAAVEEGRVIFDNIRKFVFYLFSCNLAEVMVLLVASVAGLPLPLLPLQILWLNLVTDTFPALALALEPGEPNIMERPPRPVGGEILSRSFLRALVFYASLITTVTLIAYVWGLGSGSRERALTLSFMTLALAQLFHLGNARSRLPVVRPKRAVANPWAVAAVGVVIMLQLAAVYWDPLSRVLNTTRIGLMDWLVVGGLSVLPGLVGQVTEWLQNRSNRSPPTGRPGHGASTI